ncbi:MAG: hypothetical protein Q9190_002712 [Brigantiaea leucoxantha]
MDDLSGIDWTSSVSPKASQKPPPMNQASYYPALRPTPPVSGRSTPYHPLNPGAPRSSSSTPANDSFANLVAFSAPQSNKTLSLQEQQSIKEEERRRHLKKTQPQLGDARSGGLDGHFWEKLGSTSSTPQTVSPSLEPVIAPYGIQKPIQTSKNPLKDAADITTSYQRAPQKSGDLLDGLEEASFDGSSKANGDRRLREVSPAPMESPDEPVDTDPFGLGTLSGPRNSHTEQLPVEADDDVLGLLGRPVSEFSQPQPSPISPAKPSRHPAASPFDRALAELVDMGFSPEKSRLALESTESKVDVQAAVGWLLHQAHEESRNKSHDQVEDGSLRGGRQSTTSPARRPKESSQASKPAWMREKNEAATNYHRQESRSPVNGEKDPAKIAADFGNNLFKTANSLWKTGTKKLNQAVADINSDSDSSQPKWLREPRGDSQNRIQRQKQEVNDNADNDGPTQYSEQRQKKVTENSVTDEALMLEADARPPPRKSLRPKAQQPSQAAGELHSDFEVTHGRSRNNQQPRTQRLPNPRATLSKQATEEQNSQAYVSPARRKRPTPSSQGSESLFESLQAPAAPSQIPQPKSSGTKGTGLSKGLLPSTRPPLLKRSVPPTSHISLQSSTKSRQAGSSAFKRGDYAEATVHYSSALSPLPPTHPLSIPLLTNRALSHLKIGDPKACIADSNTALDLIGPTRGVSESIDLGDEGVRDMAAYWTKAMTRQAEALEQLERWADAGAAWKTCVEAGVGGATSIAGRNRCEKALMGHSQPLASKASTAKKPPSRPKLRASALDDLTGGSTQMGEPAEAVSRLRAANLEAERLDDEKFALGDKVSERIARWRAGKEGNLRALLASLDTVLWEDSHWKKVGMGELIMASKVKVVYMKGIAKVHPDKVRFLNKGIALRSR